MAGTDLTLLPDRFLAEEIRRRWEINHKWVNIYWEEFIPFAHGVRLFGQVYNDAIKPEDPYEFVDLLAHNWLSNCKKAFILKPTPIFEPKLIPLSGNMGISPAP